MDLNDSWEEYIKDGSDHSSILLVIPGKRIDLTISRILAATLQEKFKTLVYTGALPNADNVSSFAIALTDSLNHLGAKRYTVFAEGSACNVAQAMALHSSANHTAAVRRLFLVDPQSRMSPTFTTKFLDKVESWLPLGLPLRPLNNDFDSRSTLHRLRCPVEIALTPDCGVFLRHEAGLMQKRIPNSLLIEMKHSPDSSSETEQHKAHGELLLLLNDLLQRPVKRPQKNL